MNNCSIPSTHAVRNSPYFLINTLLLCIPLLALTDRQNQSQRNELILIGLTTLTGSSRLILVRLATLTGSSRLILVGLATLPGSSRLILVGLGNLTVPPG